MRKLMLFCSFLFCLESGAAFSFRHGVFIGDSEYHPIYLAYSNALLEKGPSKDDLQLPPVRSPKQIPIYVWNSEHSLEIKLLSENRRIVINLANDDKEILWHSEVIMNDQKQKITIPLEFIGSYTLWITTAEGIFYGYVDLV